MGRRYLFGPSKAPGPVSLGADRRAGLCLTVGSDRDADVFVSKLDDWDEVAGRLPAGWAPDLVLLDLAAAALPEWIRDVPVPVVGVAPEPSASTGLPRRDWRRCDRIYAGNLGEGLHLAIDRDWPVIVEHAARRRAGGAEVAAIDRLDRALVEDPFDGETARALSEALERSGERARRARLAHDRRRLSAIGPELVPLEPWFAGAPPPVHDRVSIVVICCDQLDATRACIESVFRWTRRPYELLLVNNGSTDATPGYLDSLRERPGPDRVEVIRNPTDRGFPAAFNQAIARSRGSCVVLLDNETVMTEGWLDGLVAWSTRDWPRVGLVGAVTNRAAAPQQVAPGYDAATLAGLDDFAARRRRDYAGQAIPVERLAGSCLLIRREVLDRIGTLDDRLGPGRFDDNDLCVRAARPDFGYCWRSTSSSIITVAGPSPRRGSTSPGSSMRTPTDSARRRGGPSGRRAIGLSLDWRGQSPRPTRRGRISRSA